MIEQGFGPRSGFSILIQTSVDKLGIDIFIDSVKRWNMNVLGAFFYPQPPLDKIVYNVFIDCG